MSLSGTSTVIHQQISIKKSRSRLQSTSSAASSSASSIATGTAIAASPEAIVSQKCTSICVPVQRNKRSQRTSRGREERLDLEAIHKQVYCDSTDSENCCGTITSLKVNSNEIQSSSVIKSSERSEREERKENGKRTRSSNSGSHCPPSKRQRSSSRSESRHEIPSSSNRKRARKSLECVDSASSGTESTKRKKTKSRASTSVAATKNASDNSIKSTRRKSRLKARSDKLRETVALSDSDSSPTRYPKSRRRYRNRGKSKLQHLNSELHSNGIVQPLKGKAETVCLPQDHLYSLPPFPDFARLTMASEG